jgi:hypothetical protein
MNLLRPILIAIALSLAAISTPASAQDFQKGKQAFDRRDYATDPPIRYMALSSRMPGIL